jgi:hypothetical protein
MGRLNMASPEVQAAERALRRAAAVIQRGNRASAAQRKAAWEILGWVERVGKRKAAMIVWAVHSRTYRRRRPIPFPEAARALGIGEVYARRLYGQALAAVAAALDRRTDLP